MDALLLSRSALVAGLLALAWLAWRQRAAIVAYFLQTDSPLNLAIARVVVFAVIAGAVDIDATDATARLPRELLSPPLGMGWITGAIPLDPASVTALGWGLRLVALLAVAGLATRLTAPLAAIGAVLFFSIPNLFGHVAHTHHHLVWFAGLLALSPCADRLSLDAIVRDRRRAGRGLPPLATPPGTAYGFPLRSMLFLLAIAYFCAGFWKLWTNGVEWFAGDNLANLAVKLAWARHDTAAAMLTRLPAIASAGGLFVVTFELGFIVAIFFPRLRLLALAAALVFHTAIRLFTGIAFTELLLCYPIFLDWAAWIEPGRSDAPARGPSPSPTLLALALIMVAGNLTLGALRVGAAWPLSCYPRFDVLQTPRVTSYVVVGHRADGATVEVRDADLGEPGLRGRMHNLFRFNQNRAADLENADGREHRRADPLHDGLAAAPRPARGGARRARSRRRRPQRRRRPCARDQPPPDVRVWSLAGVERRVGLTRWSAPPVASAGGFLLALRLRHHQYDQRGLRLA